MKKLIFSMFLTASMLFAACGNSAKEEPKQEAAPVLTSDSSGVQAEAAWICPCGGCPEVREKAAGKCPKCEMDLVQEKK